MGQPDDLDRHAQSPDRHLFATARRHERRHGGIAREHAAHHDLAAGGQPLDPGGQIDHRAEIVQPVVQRDSNARPGMNADLDRDRLAALLPVECRRALLDRDGGAHRVGRLGEGGHDRVADGLDDRPPVAADDAAEIGEVLAHQVIGVGVADPLVQRRRPLQVGEHQRDLGDGNLVARMQHRVGEQVAEGLQGGDLVGGQRIGDPGARFDDQGAPALAVVVQAYRAGIGGRARRHLGPVDPHRRDRSVDVHIALPAGLQRPVAVAARRQVGRHDPALAGIEGDLQDHMRHRHWAEQAELAVLDRADGGGGLKAQLDIAREVAVVGDVAGLAMGGLRHPVERRDRELGAPAARAQQVPARLEQPVAHRLQAELRDREIVLPPVPGEPARPDADQVGLLRLQDVVGQSPGEAVAVRVGVDLGHDPVQTLGMGLVERDPLGAEHPLALPGGEPADVVDQAVEAPLRAVEEVGRQQQPAEQGRRLHLHPVDAPAAAGRRFEFDGRGERGERAAGEAALVPEPPVGHPFDRDLLPGQVQRPRLGLGEEAHGTVRLLLLTDLVFGQAGRLVEAAGIGEQRPDHLGRVIELPHHGVALHRHRPTPPPAVGTPDILRRADRRTRRRTRPPRATGC